VQETGRGIWWKPSNNDSVNEENSLLIVPKIFCVSSNGSTWNQHGRQPQRGGHKEINLKIGFAPLSPFPSTQRRGNRGGKRGRKTLLLNLFLCDVSVAAGGHVDSKSTYYYLRHLQKSNKLTMKKFHAAEFFFRRY
jgi:hypothetical protein